MTDFLSSLVQRATNQLPVLERRRPSLFEPLERTSPFSPVRPEDTLETAAEEETEHKRPQKRLRKREEPAIEDSQRDEEVRESARRPEKRRDNSRGAEPEPSGIEQHEILEPEAARPRSELPRTPPLPRTEPRLDKSLEMPRVEQKRADTSRTNQQEQGLHRPPLSKTRSIPDEPRAIHTQRTVEERLIPIMPKRSRELVRTAPILVPTPIPAPRHTIAANPKSILKADFGGASQPEPVRPSVHVSIGRIEVRANTPSAQPARKVQATEPRLGLDEYLRKRNGGSA